MKAANLSEEGKKRGRQGGGGGKKREEWDHKTHPVRGTTSATEEYDTDHSERELRGWPVGGGKKWGVRGKVSAAGGRESRRKRGRVSGWMGGWVKRRKGKKEMEGRANTYVLPAI